MTSTRIILLFMLLLVSMQAQNCPQLCLSCNSAGCNSCANSFSMTANISSSCECPTSMYLDTNYSICAPCPITCISCLNNQKCSKCIDGFTLSNNFTCIPLAITETGWTNKNASYQLNPANRNARNLNIQVGLSDYILADALASSQNCSKLPSLQWLGGQGVFGYNAKIIKSIYGLSPHQWVQIRFQIVLIDKWNGNSLIVQDLSEQLFPNTILRNASTSPNTSVPANGSRILWNDFYSSANRFRDFCGDSSIPDNLAIVDISAPHQVSALRIRIRMSDSQTPYNINSTLSNAFFGIRQLFIRVGTCGRYCLACKNPNTCQKCLSPYSLVSGICVCNSSIGFVTGSGCRSNCPPGYYLNTAILACNSCEYVTENCQMCDQKTCLSCEIGFFNLKVNQITRCVPSCPIGFSQTRLTSRESTNLTDFCSPCINNCAHCPDQLCVLCLSGYLLFGNECITTCPAGSFPSQGFCSACNPTCSVCSAVDICLSCIPGFEIQNGGKCIRRCANSTMVVNSSGCGINCSSPCSSCFGPSVNQCLSCQGILLLEDSTCVSNCSVGRFKSNFTCQTCPHGCQSCSSVHICYACAVNFYFIQNTCLRRCPITTFPMVDNANISICSPCPNGCLKCSKNICLNCKEGLVLFNSSCLSSVPQGVYYSQQFQHLKACQSNCLICNGLVCSRCNSNYYLDKGVCVISCPSNKYPFSQKDHNNQTYKSCNWKRPTCDKYDQFNNSCTQCSIFEAKLYLLNGECNYNCPEFSIISTNATCLSCPSNCKKCISNQCIQCISSHVISPDLTSCIPNYCPQQYFTDSLQCIPCVSGCSVCQIDGRCLVCSTGFILNSIQGVCFSSNCTQLTFSNSAAGICQSCMSPCKTCIKQASICTSCDPISNFPILYQSTCVYTCPGGYFTHSESRSCRKCNPKCISCSNLRSCQKCIDGYSLLSFYNPNEAECVAQCPIGFWSDLQKCQSCFKDCKSCWGPSQYQCLTCYPNFALDEFRCVWQCSVGKYRSASGYCQWCEPGCNRCNGPTLQNCLSCSTNQYLSDHVCYNNSCPAATYLAYPGQRVCQKCQFGCSLCTSPHFCRYCFSGYSLYQGWCYLQCPGNTKSLLITFTYLQGSHQNIMGHICSQCSNSYTDKCLQCTKDSCIQCQAGYYLYKQSKLTDKTLIEQCLTYCPNGTYLKNDGKPECMTCSSGCINCTTYSSCSKCSNGLNLINGYCSSSCPSGNYLNAYQSCSACPTSCASCNNAFTCTSCIPEFFLYHNSSSGNTFCVSNCSLTFYPDRSGWCQKCLPTCASCNTSSTCSSCLSGFTLSSIGICNNQSTNCPTNCQSCSGQNCLRCNSPYLLLTLPTSAATTSSCVLTCPSGFYPNTFTCERCTSGCTTCVNIENNCTSCASGLYLMNQKCIINCPVGYYASSTSLTCQQCSQNCLNCQNNNCMICQSGYYLSSGSCYSACPLGTYPSLTNSQCYSCPSQCSSCTVDQNCTSCISGYLLLEGSCVKNCPQTAYLQQSKCILCVAPCLACTSMTKCLTCLPGLILNGTECQSECQAGFFKYSFKVNYTSQIPNLDFSTLTNCMSCDSSCATCSDSSKNCQSCIQPYVLYGSSCLNSCPPTTYLSDGKCKPCSPFCAVCIDFNQCLACVNTTTLFANQCYTVCPPGYQMSSQVNCTINSYVCHECSPACLTCRGSSSYDCLSCNTGYYWLNGSSCVNTCPTGYYSNFNSQSCLPCPYGCATCISPNNCTTCIYNFTLSSTRTCQGNSSNCNSSNCLNCLSNSLSKCGQCKIGFSLFNDICYSSCPTSTYSNNGKCTPCLVGCLSCSSHRCLTCNISFILYQGICISDCPYGTLKINNTCTKDACLSKSPSGDCQACISPYFLYSSQIYDNQSNSYQQDDNQSSDYEYNDDQYNEDQSTNTQNVICVLACPSGTYLSGGACIKCRGKCLNCISSSQCIQCKSQYFLFNGKCYEDCPLGTYTSSANCKNCTLSFCSKCQQSNGVEKCEQCKQGTYLYNSNCVLACPLGTYVSYNSQYCKNCPQSCSECLNSDSCTVCKNGTVLYRGKCLTNCPTGTYLNSNACKQCPTGCSQCQSISNCLNCQLNYIQYTSSNTSSCLSSCPLGFFAQSSPSTTYSNSYQLKCVQCISPCLTCKSNTSCTSCPVGYSLMQNKCLNSCPTGYFSTTYQIVTVGGQNIETSRCAYCSPICLSCSGVSNNCSSCPSGYILASNTCVSNCSENGLYFNSLTRDCNECSITCYSCSGPTTSNCLSCTAPLQLYAGNCLSACPFGYYPTPTQICQPCAPTCASCSGSAYNCTLCSSPLILQALNNIGSCVQSCSVGFYSTNGNCQQCSSKCLSCFGPNDNQCLSCKAGLFLVSQSCVPLCPSGSTAIITTNQLSCVPCSTNCIACFYQSAIQTTRCSQCATGYYLSNGICTLACPTGTYPSPVSFTCDNCNLAKCTKCMLSTSFVLSCIQCQVGHYLFNSTCLSSCPNNTISKENECVPKPVCTMYEWNGYCLSECPANTYKTSVSTVTNGVTVMSLSCKNCSIYCQQCSSELNCVVCTSGTYLIMRSSPNNSSYQCVTICPLGYYQISGSCMICPSSCATCQLINSEISCITCPSGLLLMGSQCTSSCPDGYYSSSGSCNLCSAICASCSGSASNCTVCKNMNSYAPSCNTSAINCTSIQYLSSATTCSNCHQSCLTCFGGSSSQCSSCASALILTLGNCIANCPLGTIRSGTVCINCPNYCLNCSLLGTSAICNTCALPYLLVPSTGTCVSDCSNLNTPNTSFLLINGICSPCNITGCLSCILRNGAPSCLACKNGTILYNQTCSTTCPSGTVANYEAGACVFCSSNCATCSTSGCITCSTSYFILDGRCVSNCGTGYYISNSTCNKCTITNCLNCTATSCTNCQQPYTLNSGQCSNCLSGYYFQGGICQACSSYCVTCFGSSTNCTACKLGYFFYNSTCVASCPSGFYITTAGLCANCTVNNCKECTSNGCSVCQAGFVSVITNGVKSCQATCPSATYLDSSNTCYNCSTGCLLCTLATSCNACNSPYVLQQGYCLSQCPSGLYNSNGTCQNCPATCKTCVSATNCITCSSGLSISNGICVSPPSNCSIGYFRNILGNCDQCFASCKSCQGQSSSDCLSCFSGYTLTNGVCIQICNSTSFYNTATLSCQSCLSLTTNCLSCNQTNCLVCNTSYTVLSGKCTQVCPAGTFLNNNNCLPCSSYCISCGSGSACNKCLNSSFIIVNGQCVSECPDQTYLKNGQCAACYQTCLTCTASSTNCSSCLSPYYLYLSSCVSSCPNGTYEDTTYTCQNCSSNCKLCSSLIKCDQCTTGFYLINGTCRSSCPNGYYIDTTTNRCIECLYPCLSCIARNKCSSCASPSVLSNSMCISSNCTGGYYDFSLNACQNCTVNNCGYCTNSSCSYCKNGYYSVYSSSIIVYCQTNCPDGTYKDNATYNCSSCYTNCKLCQNSTWCNTCQPNYFLLTVEKSSVNECIDTCPQGYYKNSSTCKPCLSYCQSCSSSQSCMICKPDYFLLTTGSSSKCVQNCPTAYYTPTDLTGSGQCGPCSGNCISCLDIVTCLQCESGFRVFNGVCVPSNCVNCQICNATSNICVSCDSGYYIFDNACIKTCPDYYFGSNFTGKCQKCIDNCLVCGDATSCFICITGYEFVNATGCQNSGFLNFGALGNMSGFTSNITQIMAMVYVTTSTGPIAFGALSSTYGLMQLCQVLYIMQGTTSDNQQMNTFLNSLSATSYTSNSGTGSTDTDSSSTSSISSKRLLTAVDYTSNFFQTNLPIFLMMIAFVSAYVLVLLFEKYQNSCCLSCPNLMKYISYTCQFMKMRFKYIYVDTVMWISYLPFLYFSILQLKKGDFSTGTSVFSSLLAIIIIIVYPLYPLFILRKLFDRSQDPQENLKNYKSIALLEPLVEDNKSLCADFSCCPKKDKLTYQQMVEKNKLAMVQMSLSPYIEKVKRPVFNEHMEEYNQFKYFKKQHWILAYAAIKYFRKFLIALVVAVCSSPSLTLGIVLMLIVGYMAYLIVLKPKQKLYLVLEIILESVLLIFIMMMLIYVSIGGATVTAMSVVTHAVGFIIANSSLLIAIILNIMSYYTIFCCIYDLIQHLKNKVVEEEYKEKNFNEMLEEKDKIHIDDDIKDKDKDSMEIKIPRRGDDEQTEENNDERQNYENFELDQKQFVPGSNLIKKNTFRDDEDQDFTNLKSTKGGRREKRRQERSKSRHLDQESHTSEEIMGHSKISNEQLHDVSDGLLKQRDNKFRRDINSKDINVIKGQIRDPTDKFKRHSKKLPHQEQQSIDTLNIPQGKEEILIDMRTQDRLSDNPRLIEREKYKKEDQANIDSIKMKQREKNKKSLNEANFYDRQGKPKKVGQNEADLPEGKFIDKNNSKKSQPFGQFEELFAKEEEQANIKNAQLKQRQLRQRQAKINKQVKKKEDEQIMDIDMIDRVQKAKKQENKHYKGSDEQVDIQEGQARQVKNKFRKEGKRKIPNPSQQIEANINAFGKDIITKKAQKLVSNREFAQDNQDQLIYKERLGKNISKAKETNKNLRPEDNLNEVEAYNREKKIIEKKQKVQQMIPQQNLLSVGFKEVEKRKSSKQKPSIYDNLDKDLTESIQFGDASKPKGKKMAASQQEVFEQSQMSKIRAEKIGKNKSGNGRLDISENLEESYEDTIKKNKQQMFKQKQQRKSQLMELSEDPFEQVEYQRPESKMQRPSSRNKDLGLGINSRQGSEASDDQSRDVRKRKNSALQRIRKRGQLNINENNDKDNQDNVGSDSRRVSRVAKNKSKLKGVLNIDDKSQNEDIEEMKF